MMLFLAGLGDQGILNPLLHQYNDRLCGARTFTFPAVKACLDYKWDCWARSFLIAEVRIPSLDSRSLAVQSLWCPRHPSNRWHSSAKMIAASARKCPLYKARQHM